MTQPSYTTDLTDIVTCESGESYSNFTNYSTGSGQNPETEFFIQGAACASMEAKGKTTCCHSICTVIQNPAITFATDECFFIWIGAISGNVMDTYNNGGFRIVIGSSNDDWIGWKVGGSDFGRNPYGGWQNFCADPTVTADYSRQTSTTNYQRFGAAWKLTAALNKGAPLFVDVMRYGRGEILAEHGDVTSGYCTFGEMAAANDANDISFTGNTTNADATVTNIGDTGTLYPGAPLSGTGIPASTFVKSITNSTTIEMTNNATATNTGVSITSQPYNRWGLFQEQAGNILWKGLMTLGTSTNAVDFRDSNVNIVVDQVPKTFAAFNKIEVNNASSNVEWTSISIQAPAANDYPEGESSILSPGRFECVDSADVAFDSCTFSDMGTFVFDAATGTQTVLGCTFNRCGQVTAGGADFTGSSFLSSTAAASLLWNTTDDTDGNADNCIFESDGSNHAIQFNSFPVGDEVTLRGITFTGYATSDGSTGNEAVYVNIGSGTLTINAVGCSGTVSVRTAGATVSVVNDPVTVKGVALTSSGAALTGCTAMLMANSEETGGLPYDDTVTIVNSGTTATVTHTAHGLLSNDKIRIKGASHAQNNGVFTITYINANSYSYTMASAPGSSPTGTIKANFVYFYGAANAGTGSNEISMTRVLPTAQDVLGWIRKGSTSPYYKEGTLTGRVSTTENLTLNGILTSDG